MSTFSGGDEEADLADRKARALFEFKYLLTDPTVVKQLTIVEQWVGRPLALLLQLLQRLDKALIEAERKSHQRHWEDLRFHALSLKHRWRKGDIPKLPKIGISPESREVKPYIEFALHNRKRGRGVILRPINRYDILHSGFTFLKGIADPKTPRHIRRHLYRQSRWFPELVEAAYRGELLKIHQKCERGAGPERPSEIAEWNVATAAGISSASVRRLCYQVRKDLGKSRLDNPPTSAAELKQHLEEGHEVVRQEALRTEELATRRQPN